MQTAARTRGPKTRKARPAPTGQAYTNFHNSNGAEDITTRLRVQALIATIGLAPERARLVASLAWGAPHHG